MDQTNGNLERVDIMKYRIKYDPYKIDDPYPYKVDSKAGLFSDWKILNYICRTIEEAKEAVHSDILYRYALKKIGVRKAEFKNIIIDVDIDNINFVEKDK